MLHLHVLFQTGFYRVNYTDEHWEALGNALASFSAADRLGLASDVYALFKVPAASLSVAHCVAHSC